MTQPESLAAKKLALSPHHYLLQLLNSKECEVHSTSRVELSKEEKNSTRFDEIIKWKVIMRPLYKSQIKNDP